MTKIHPLFLMTQDTGGAAIAALRLADALQVQEVDVSLLTYYKQSEHPTVKPIHDFTSHLEEWWLDSAMKHTSRVSEKYRVSHNSMWSSNLTPNPLHRILNRTLSNLLHLHWIGTGFLPLASFARLNKPIVWTLHDMWAFTGGCHYSHGCNRYTTHCADCPLLDNPSKRDKSYQVFENKIKHWQNIPMTIITPSRWLASCARESAILQRKMITIIPNPVDTTWFKPHDNKAFARQVYDLPPDKKLILFGASNIQTSEKGFPLLLSALTQFPADEVELVIIGAENLDKRQIPIPVHTIDRIDESIHILLPILYNAVDVVVLPSYEDNLPNTILEGLACGTPCVAFNIGGMPDMIDHQQNGYLAEPYSVDDLARGIQWVLSEADAVALSHNAREKVLAHFSMEVVAKQYVEVYKQTLQAE
jgi:glycosyltransferase involved in cell wall biosynthesis